MARFTLIFSDEDEQKIEFLKEKWKQVIPYKRNPMNKPDRIKYLRKSAIIRKAIGRAFESEKI